MNFDLNFTEIKKEWHGTFKGYVIGFIASLILTTLSFLLVITQVFSNQILIYTIVALALIQAIFQLLFFLHLGKEDKPKWESMIFYFMILILVIIVVGSLWIMRDLDERLMPMQMEMSHD